MDTLQAAIDRAMRDMAKHGESYARAWIAATGLHPTECEIVQEVTWDGPKVTYRSRIEPRRRRT